jgi:hypothetical protein
LSDDGVSVLAKGQQGEVGVDVNDLAPFVDECKATQVTINLRRERRPILNAFQRMTTISVKRRKR